MRSLAFLAGMLVFGTGEPVYRWVGPHVSAQDAPATSCADCHDGKADAKFPGPPHQLLADSVHRSLDCIDCHQETSMEELDPGALRPHGEVVAQVDCGECHEDEAETYRNHGRLEIGKDPDLPRCWSCHGAHDILPSSDRQSHVHVINLPSTCRTCHTDVDLVKKHDILRDSPIRLYAASVHGRATRKGVYVAATCNDCHSATTAEGTRTAHRILSPADPDSTIYHFNIPDTCGQCHEHVTQDYWEGIHGQFVKRGSVDAPVCTHCHGEHGIISPDDPLSPVSPARMAEETCAPCHESVVLNAKYGLARGPLVSYIDSYHGLKSKAGDVAVANCASCHGSHRVLPSTDSTSSIHPNNLQATCGECHPGITPELAQTSIHETAAELYTGWPQFFRKLYIVLIVGTIGLMLLHNVCHWIRRIKQMRQVPSVQRLSGSEVLQHWVLMLSFIVLVVSGFSLRFSGAGWVKLLFGWEGGFELRGVIHRVAAVVMMFGAVWHAVYLFTARGRQYVKDMMLERMDIAHVKDNALYFLGRRDGPPRFKRFSYIEKCEYWALVWGTAIMTVTGLLLWFDNYFVEQWRLPKVVLDCALVIHYYEAWLAFLAILVWHIYDTVLSPSVYPMNPAWLSGRMPKSMYMHEHPEGPKLKARTYTARYEDEEEGELSENGNVPSTVRDSGGGPS
jgi:cytochrome b subunit of formate dehydrogenase